MLGYLEAGSHILSTVLGTSVLHAAQAGAEIHCLPTGLGLGAFALGALGFFGVGRWLAARPEKGLPVPGGLLADALVSDAKLLPQGVAAVHNGHVGRYLLLTVLGAAVIAGLALRTPRAPLPKQTRKSNTVAIPATTSDITAPRVQPRLRPDTLRNLRGRPGLSNSAGPPPGPKNTAPGAPPP